jgi:hypothetical protein
MQVLRGSCYEEVIFQWQSYPVIRVTILPEREYLLAIQTSSGTADKGLLRIFRRG